MELRAAQRREYIRVRVDLEVSYTPISPEECRQLRSERSERTLRAWPEIELPRYAQDSDAEGLLSALRIINEKLDYIVARLCEGKAPEHPYSGNTIDVSGGGVCIAVREPQPVGTFLDISLVLPTRPDIRLDLLGQVQVVEKPDPQDVDPCHKLGVEFIGLGDVDRDRLVRYIFQKQRECLRHGLKPA
ncbi:MAG: PilZ domain-containing protein [Pseudomonadota bacterium]